MPLSQLNVGDSVRTRLWQHDWTPVVVKDLHSAPRSYLVTTQNGRVYCPNRRVINPSAEPPPVVLAAQEETPAFPSVPSSQTSTLVGLTQQEETPQQPSLPDPEVQTTPVRVSNCLRRQPLWMADYVNPWFLLFEFEQLSQTVWHCCCCCWLSFLTFILVDAWFRDLDYHIVEDIDLAGFLSSFYTKGGCHKICHSLSPPWFVLANQTTMLQFMLYKVP